jgi:hypothetical protein
VLKEPRNVALTHRVQGDMLNQILNNAQLAGGLIIADGTVKNSTTKHIRRNANSSAKNCKAKWSKSCTLLTFRGKSMNGNTK